MTQTDWRSFHNPAGHLDEFRAYAREWLAANAPSAEPGRFLGRGWEASLFAAGLNGLSWPVEYGGGGRSMMHEVVVLEELARFGVSESVGFSGKRFLGPTLLECADSEQCARFLPPTLRGEIVWCQGFSEPEAGSDLASVRTRARRTDGGWLLTGQKIWTSRAKDADWMFALVRTSTSGPKHAGLTFVLVDMDQPGLTVRPLKQANGRAEFSEVFFDDAFVADRDVVGDVGAGWRVAGSALKYERGIAHLGRQISFMEEWDRLRARLAEGSSAVARDELCRLYVRLHVYRSLGLRQVAELDEGRFFPPEGSITKLFWSETYVALHRFTRGLDGWSYRAGPGEEPYEGTSAVEGQLGALSRRIAGGTSEIQKNIVARRVLGLPEGHRS